MKLVLLTAACLSAALGSGLDSDRDGIPDSREQQLLELFAPTFFIGEGECDGRPSAFQPGSLDPRALGRDGTIYAQVFPYPHDARRIEIHYYHLWRNDCGSVPHPLDAEHVAVLIDSATDRALYWFAAAHQDTLCDASQGVRAGSIDAETRGARVWISEGKHASYLSEASCQGGCGQDRCTRPVELERGALVNLGEYGAPMNGAVWINSAAWPLAVKTDTDFAPALVARLDAEDGMVALSTAPRGMRRTIATSNATAGAIATGGRETDSAVQSAFEAADRSLAATGNALSKAHRATKRWLAGRFRRK